MMLNEKQRSYLVQELDYRNRYLREWTRTPDATIMADSILAAIYRTILQLDELSD